MLPYSTGPSKSPLPTKAVGSGLCSKGSHTAQSRGLVMRAHLACKNSPLFLEQRPKDCPGLSAIPYGQYFLLTETETRMYPYCTTGHGDRTHGVLGGLATAIHAYHNIPPCVQNRASVPSGELVLDNLLHSLTAARGRP